MRDHRKLTAFQLADAFVLAIYKATKDFPREEQFGITSQLRRAAVSVAANIVEGSARSGEKDYVKFLGIAFASLREAGYFIELAGKLEYLTPAATKDLLAQYDHCARVLSGLVSSFREKD